MERNFMLGEEMAIHPNDMIISHEIPFLFNIQSRMRKIENLL